MDNQKQIFEQVVAETKESLKKRKTERALAQACIDNLETRLAHFEKLLTK